MCAQPECDLVLHRLCPGFIRARQMPCPGAIGWAEPGDQAGTLMLLFLVLIAYWRFWLCVSVVYELFLIFILFQVSDFS